MIKKLFEYFGDVKKEFHKISFISRKDVQTGTIAVMVMILVLGLIFSLFDLIIRSFVLFVVGV
jgi:preprotein translocase SecE subunit